MNRFQSSKVVIYGIFGGFVGALVMGVIAYMMPIPNTGGAPFFVAAAMLMGMGPMSWAAGWTLHLVTGVIVGAIFGVLVAKVSSLGIKTTSRALVLGGAAGVAVFVVFFIPMMVILMPALMGMPAMVGGGFVAHVIFGLVLGGVTSFAVPKSGGAMVEEGRRLEEHGKAHMSSTSTNQFKCPACGAAFSNQQELMDHNAKAHPM